MDGIGKRGENGGGDGKEVVGGEPGDKLLHGTGLVPRGLESSLAYCRGGIGQHQQFLHSDEHLLKCTIKHIYTR